MIRTLDLPITGRGADLLKPRAGHASLFLAGTAFGPRLRLIGTVNAMWLFVAEIFCIYALAAVLTFKETRTVAFVTSGGSFIFPIIAIYVAVALVTFLAQTSNLTLESAFELG